MQPMKSRLAKSIRISRRRAVLALALFIEQRLSWNRLVIRLSGMAPVAGARPDPPKDDPPKDDPPKDDPPKDDPPKDGEKVELSKADHDNLQRQLRESRETNERHEREKEQREREERERGGDYKTLYEQEKTQREQEKRERDEERQRDQQQRHDDRAVRIATRLKFDDGDDAVVILKRKLGDGAAEVLADSGKTEKALRDLATEKPKLVTDGDVPRQRDLGNGDGGGNSDAQVSGPTRLARAYGSSGS